MRYSRFRIALKDIINFFEARTQKVYSANELSHVLEDNREFWRLTYSMTTREFIEDLLNYTKIQEVVIRFPDSDILRYTYGTPDKYDLSVSLKPKAYLSHYTSLVLHDLTEQEPKVVYVTYEQSKKNSSKQFLIQKNVDAAFAKPQRISKNIAVINEEYSIALLTGKQTNNIGVERNEDSGLLFTGIERTLIDCAVRPEYAGGPGEVLKGFKNAQSRISINKLAAILSNMDFIYPYHQAIGFYLDKAGNYRESQISILREIPKAIDFYLAYDIRTKEYSSEWKLYYPKGF